ncbi:MAG: DUF2341 domain-containing protein [Candidatus Pacebacteria bacterium]|nr:DUF2341 domain-containing protein [Candidatus Paceibacterota bacterium]
MKQTKSFTLIEVLVGIVVVGILSSFIIVSVSSFIDDANDSKRKKDLDSIATSLLTYKTLTGSYPIEESDCNIGDGTCLDELTESGYATNFPIDPDNTTRYTYTSDGTTYTIKASLSNNQTLTYNPDTGYSEYQGLAGLDGYAKRKSITIASSASLTNYQMKFIVHRSDGSDDEEDVYIGSSGCESDYDDIRFTNSSNQLLDYWIESSDSLSATIWVEADSLASGNTTLYLYYGNSGASAVSSAEDVFLNYTTFPGSSLPSGWSRTESDYGSYAVTSGYLQVTGATGSSGTWLHNRVTNTYSIPINTVTTFKVAGMRYVNRHLIQVGLSSSTSGTGLDGSDESNSIRWTQFYDASYCRVNIFDNGATYYSSSCPIPSSCRIDIVRDSINEILFNVDSVTKISSLTRVPEVGMYAFIRTVEGAASTSSAEYIRISEFYVRKYVSPEPSASWGSEESF